MTVVVTGSRRAAEQSMLVTNLGGEPYVVPTVGISIPASDDEVKPFLARLTKGGVDYAVFMTATGVRALMLAAERLGMREALVGALNAPKTTVVARSSKPKGELVNQGVEVDATPPREEATADGIVELLRGHGLEGKTVAILWHGSRNGSTSRQLADSGAKEVIECLSYRYSRGLGAGEAKVLRSMGFRYQAPEEGDVSKLIDEIVSGDRRLDAITFTSPPSVTNLFDAAAERGREGRLKEELNRGRIIVVAVGPTTRAELEGYGVDVAVMPKVSAMGAMMNSLAEYVRSM